MFVASFVFYTLLVVACRLSLSWSSHFSADDPGMTQNAYGAQIVRTKMCMYCTYGMWYIVAEI